MARRIYTLAVGLRWRAIYRDATAAGTRGVAPCVLALGIATGSACTRAAGWWERGGVDDVKVIGIKIWGCCRVSVPLRGADRGRYPHARVPAACLIAVSPILLEAGV